MEETRKIIHIDMDAFYASVEQRDHPELQGLPLAVGGIGGRGVVATASYEARKYGVHSAMSMREAHRRCPILRVVLPDFQKYNQVSLQIREIFGRYTDIIEPLSLDEAYLDVTYARFEVPSATILAKRIKEDIQNELNLIASAGVSYNKFLAKIASDQDKPDGLFVITPEQGAEFMKTLPIEKFFGVGKVTAEKLKSHNIFKGADVLPYSRWELQQLFGKHGGFLYDVVRGIDNRLVQPERERKSVGVENTFSDDIIGWDRINEEFSLIFETWWTRYQKVGKKGKSLTIKVRNKDFETITRSQTEKKYVIDKQKTRKIFVQLLEKAIDFESPIRLLGVSISSLEKENNPEFCQLTLW